MATRTRRPRDIRDKAVRDLLHAASHFWLQVVRPDAADDADACWTYTGGINSNGYGIFHFGPKKMYAHRFAFSAANGRWIPDGLLVCHRCDVRTCVRPSHLFLGTELANARDREMKRRLREIGRVRRVGNRIVVPLSMPVTTPDERAERARIIRKLDEYEYPQRFIAAQFNVHLKTVQRILETDDLQVPA